MTENGKCILCENPAEITSYGDFDQEFRYRCANCGFFSVTDTFRNLYKLKEAPRHLLAGYARELTGSGKHALFSFDSVKIILDSPLIPRSPFEKLDKLLLWYYKQSDVMGKYIRVSNNPAICYAFDQHELRVLYEQLLNSKLIPSPIGGNILDNNHDVYLSLEGYRRCADLLSKTHPTKNAFVAMWFRDEMEPVYTNAIVPAIEKCGFKPIRVDNVEHNNDITDEIIAGIKNSRFVIADMTGYRGGVYYEAGFARGLGLPVIFTCRKDWFEGEKDAKGNTIKEKIHFDINHMNIIVWETEESLRKRIIDRIRATIL